MDSFHLQAARYGRDFPSELVPEVAFVGRSNSGKSTFLNAFLGQKHLARTSSMPGRTRLAHFFQAQWDKQHPFLCIDLPGYGYAQGLGKEKYVWDGLVRACMERRTLKGIFYISDFRRLAEPFEWSWLEERHHQGLSIWIIFTKTDKLNQREQKLQNEIQKKHWQKTFKPQGWFCLELKGHKEKIQKQIIPIHQLLKQEFYPNSSLLENFEG